MTLTAHAATRTHVGHVRRRNEDAAYAGTHLFAVADGLGGHPAGDVAAQTVIDVLRPCDRPADAADLPHLLGGAIHTAGGTLREAITADPTLTGMGTTLVALMWSGATAVVANVGDSRAYLLPAHATPGTPLRRLTEDHTYRNLIADADAVPNLPARIARFLDGRPEGRSPDLTTHTLYPGDRFLLCSDGLTEAVPGKLLTEALRAPADPPQIADHLITLALDHGGPDNVTVIVIDMKPAS
ncbi:PP2C family protein-serine/threonine phosphatase [Streptosporangium sp. NPDC001559]|uniref:PP2C family protein-serine/threonine phosphatase n=1 Tax=Streptosporangium sp. NPDC001559 TaxID=3366187 RepID=UPI0036E2DD86